MELSEKPIHTTIMKLTEAEFLYEQENIKVWRLNTRLDYACGHSNDIYMYYFNKWFY